MRRALAVALAGLTACKHAPPAAKEEHFARVVQLAVGEAFACGLDERGRVRCWGSDPSGALGVPGIDHVDAYAKGTNVEIGGKVQSIVAGSHACAILEGGKLRCWGENRFGQLGYPHRKSGSKPDGDVDLGGPVVEVAMGAVHTCARLASGAVRCWGEHMPTKFAEGTTPAQLPPIDLGEPARSIATGAWESCALLVSGVIKCWGESGFAGVDYPKFRVVDPKEPIDRIAFHFEYIVGTTPAGHLVRIEQKGATLEKAVSLAFDRKLLAFDHGCGLLDGGRVRCWGSSERLDVDVGMLGVPGLHDQPITSPTGRDVDIGGRAQSVGADMMRCALREDGRVFCWGMVDMGHPSGTNTRVIGKNETPAAFGPIHVFDD